MSEWDTAGKTTINYKLVIFQREAEAGKCVAMETRDGGAFS
jgi:hypothetical protein